MKKMSCVASCRGLTVLVLFRSHQIQNKIYMYATIPSFGLFYQTHFRFLGVQMFQRLILSTKSIITAIEGFSVILVDIVVWFAVGSSHYIT